MRAVFRREMHAYFTSPIGFAFIGAGFLFSGLYFYAYNLYGGSTNLSSLFSVLFSVVLFMIPVLTMRLFSEERRQRTDVLLMSAPVSGAGVALGKYLAAMCVYGLSIASTLVDAVVLSRFVRVGWRLVFGNWLGLMLLGAALIAVCMFLSSLTENQLAAAVGGFCVGLIVILIDALEPMVNADALQTLFAALNFATRYQPFTYGLVSLENLVFFLSVAALFVVFSAIRFERRRWQ